MIYRTMIAAAAVVALTGSAFAQETGAVPTEPAWTAEEQAIFQQHRALYGGFFTDETFAELRSPEEMELAWGGLTEADQQTIHGTCADVAANPANHSQAMLEFCDVVGHY
jgi:hypothetical protein